LGYAYEINQSMADLGTSGSPLAGNISMLFGDFSQFIVRDVLDSRWARLINYVSAADPKSAHSSGRMVTMTESGHDLFCRAKAANHRHGRGDANQQAFFADQPLYDGVGVLGADEKVVAGDSRVVDLRQDGAWHVLGAFDTAVLTC
jgi:hypothetical protein